MPPTREQIHLMRRFRGGRLAGAATLPPPGPGAMVACANANEPNTNGPGGATRPGWGSPWGTGASGPVGKQFYYRAGRAWKLLRAKRGAEEPSPSPSPPEAQPAFGCSKIKIEKALRMPGKDRGVRFRGVHFHHGKWVGQITKKNIHLGCFHDSEAAARTYDQAAIANLGRDRAVTNFDVNEYAAEFDKLEELGVVK